LIALDSSAIVAVALKEPGGKEFREAIIAHRCVIGAPTLLECHMVLRPGPDPATYESFRKLISRPHIQIEDFTREHYDYAAAAFDRYGRGRGHPAQLNFGDCMSYAVAKLHGVPLLYKGDDFAQTDIASAFP
jgi:ribonuclease VapC